jgi:hypothetical protein
MRARNLAAAVGAAVLMLGGCDAAGDNADGPPELFTEKPTVNAAVCNDPDLAPQAWAAVCRGYGEQPKKAPPPTQLAFGQPANTFGKTDYGAKESGTLKVTPASVVYDRGHLIVAVTLDNPGAVPASPADGTQSGGWTYTTPSGEKATAESLVVNGFNNAWFITVAPGATERTIQAWSIRDDQRGGTLQFIDGAYKVYTWQVPAVDTGPQVAEVRAGLK